jgi:hypothetical protein
MSGLGSCSGGAAVRQRGDGTPCLIAPGVVGPDLAPDPAWIGAGQRALPGTVARFPSSTRRFDSRHPLHYARPVRNQYFAGLSLVNNGRTPSALSSRGTNYPIGAGSCLKYRSAASTSVTRRYSPIATRGVCLTGIPKCRESSCCRLPPSSIFGSRLGILLQWLADSANQPFAVVVHSDPHANRVPYVGGCPL